MSGTADENAREPAPLSDSAACFIAALTLGCGGQKATGQDITAAFRTACPGTSGTPRARPVLATLLGELADAQLVTLPRGRSGWDAGSPAIPLWVRLPAPEPEPRGPRLAPPVWRTELRWAAQAALTPGQVDTLRTVNRWLRDSDGTTATQDVVPMRERSLEIFGDEKRLDRLLPTTLFAPDRLTLALLRAKRIPPPLAHTRIGDGNILLVVENSDTYHTLSTLLSEMPGRVGYVAFGAGHAFEASVARVGSLSGITDIAYYGDLDVDGLIIPSRADATAAQLGLPSVRPAAGLYDLLLQSKRQPSHDDIDDLYAEHLSAWLPANLRSSAADTLAQHNRIAQEATGTSILRMYRAWARDL